VLSLGLQATGARRTATTPEAREEIEARVLRLTRRCAVGVVAVSLAMSPLLEKLLRLDSIWSAVLMGVSAGFLCLMGGQAGILQGEQRWLPLALVYSTMGTARLVLGCVALLVSPTTTSVMLGVAVAAAAPAVVGALALHRPSTGPAAPPVGAEPPEAWIGYQGGSMLREIAHSSHALLAFFAMSNIDMVLARALLPDYQAGLYASGLVLTKAALFLPQFVVIFLFPAMAKSPRLRQTHLAGGAVIALTGLIAAGAVALLPTVSLQLVGGSQYADVGAWLWLFAGLGTVLAVVQLLVYGALAERQSRTVWVLWVGCIITAVAATQVNEAVHLLVLKVGIDAALLVAIILVLVVSGSKAPRSPAAVHPTLAEDVSSPEQPAVR